MRAIVAFAGVAFSIAVGCCASAGAQISVEISPVFKVYTEQTIQVGMRFVFPLELGSLRRGDSTVIDLVSGSNRKFLLEFLPRQQVAARLERMQSIKMPWTNDSAMFRPFPIQSPVGEDGEYTALIYSDDVWFGAEDLTVKYSLTRQLSLEEQGAIGRQFGKLAEIVDSTFITPAFRIRVGACGQLNAFSLPPSGDITYCSELLARLGGSVGATYGVFFHELGHTLLGVWGLPGAAEENMADQFAVYMLLQLHGGIGAADDLATYFDKSSNPWIEARQIINVGDAHAIGVQRARNIRQILRDPEEFMERWNREVYPKMQVTNLRRIISAPRPFESVAMAKEELIRRGERP
jgi:Putative metallopeptidase